MIDLRDEPATLNNAVLSARLADVDRSTVLVTYEQLVDVFTMLQESAMPYTEIPVGEYGSVSWHGFTFQTEVAA